MGKNLENLISLQATLLVLESIYTALEDNSPGIYWSKNAESFAIKSSINLGLKFIGGIHFFEDLEVFSVSRLIRIYLSLELLRFT